MVDFQIDFAEETSLTPFTCAALVLLRGVLTVLQGAKVALGVVIMIIILVIHVCVPRKFAILGLVISAGFVLRGGFPCTAYFLLVDVNRASAIGFRAFIGTKLLCLCH